MSAKKFQGSIIGTVVKVKPERGHGSEDHTVVEVSGFGHLLTYKLRNNKTGKTFDIFAAHTFQTIQNRFETHRAKIVAAKAIGVKKT
jgi:hypothetical protein